jgi:hypothetical protein
VRIGAKRLGPNYSADAGYGLIANSTFDKQGHFVVIILNLSVLNAEHLPAFRF